MDYKAILTRPEAYIGQNLNIPPELKQNAQRLCWEYNQTPPDQPERRRELLEQLFGSCHPLTFVEPTFHCDYGFNIHTHGLTVINYNCVILDTSPVEIGAGSVVTHDIPAGMVAAGAPCRPIRPVTEADRVAPDRITF